MEALQKRGNPGTLGINRGLLKRKKLLQGCPRSCSLEEGEFEKGSNRTTTRIEIIRKEDALSGINVIRGAYAKGKK